MPFRTLYFDFASRSVGTVCPLAGHLYSTENKLRGSEVVNHEIRDPRKS